MNIDRVNYHAARWRQQKDILPAIQFVDPIALGALMDALGTDLAPR